VRADIVAELGLKNDRAVGSFDRPNLILSRCGRGRSAGQSWPPSSDTATSRHVYCIRRSEVED